MSALSESRTPLAAFRARATERPTAVALVDHDGRPWTRAALLADADAALRGLRARGFAAGDRVLFSVRPGAKAVALALAVYELGGVFVPQDPGVGDALFRARLAALAPRWVFAESVLLLRPSSVLARLLRTFGLHFAPLAEVAGATFLRVGPALPGVVRAVGYAELPRTQGAEPLPGAAAVPPDADASIIHTSGTTAAPRAVVFTRAALESILRCITRELALADGDVLYARDLHLVLPALASGATAIAPPATQFNAAAVLRRMTAWRVTHAFLVTRDCRLLLEHLQAGARGAARALPASLRMLMIGAAPVRADFLSRLRAVLPSGCVACCTYGCTEMLPIASIALEEKLAWAGEGDVVGRPIAGATPRIRDDGQLAVRGERACRGYLGETPLEEVVTGDLARLDDAGRIVLLGRAKDMLIRGETNIYPELYEPIIERIPGVRRAAIIGDFDAARADERVVLVVEPEPGVDPAVLERRVAAALRQGPQRIDTAALPDRILARAIPEGGRSGKIDKQALRRALGLRPPLR